MEISFIHCVDRTAEIDGNYMDYEEELYVTVEFLGKYRPAVYHPIDKAEPAEYPEIEIISAINHLHEDVADTLPANVIDAIEQRAWEIYDEERI
jgi:hypothetical protein